MSELRSDRGPQPIYRPAQVVATSPAAKHRRAGSFSASPAFRLSLSHGMPRIFAAGKDKLTMGMAGPHWAQPDGVVGARALDTPYAFGPSTTEAQARASTTRALAGDPG